MSKLSLIRKVSSQDRLNQLSGIKIIVWGNNMALFWGVGARECLRKPIYLVMEAESVPIARPGSEVFALVFRPYKDISRKIESEIGVWWGVCNTRWVTVAGVKECIEVLQKQGLIFRPQRKITTVKRCLLKPAETSSACISIIHGLVERFF